MESNTNFILTVLILIAALIAGLIYALLNVVPNNWNVYVFALVLAFTSSLVGALILYGFWKPEGMESQRHLFRRCFRINLITGAIVFSFLVLQRKYNLI